MVDGRRSDAELVHAPRTDVDVDGTRCQATAAEGSAIDGHCLGSTDASGACCRQEGGKAVLVDVAARDTD
jgi:hypothetical protein